MKQEYRAYRTKLGTMLPLLVLKGQEYLEVKHRLVWFREERPDWRIETEFLSVSTTECVARATILNEKGERMATAHKAESKENFFDFMEKSETGAIGRALAFVGYGTQFVGEELSEAWRVVDSPVTKAEAESPVQADDGPQSTDPENPGEYKINFGKYKGSTVIEALDKDGLPAVEKYIDWIEDTATKSGKPISANARFFKVAVGRYLEKERAAGK